MAVFDGRALLASKMAVPRPRSAVVARARLHEKLCSAGECRCTMVVAPAGWGKSTLLAGWAHDPTQPRRVGWLSLDEGDDDPVRFWTYAISALAVVAPEVCREPLAALSGQGLDPVDVVVPALLNALSRSEDDYALVLDDYHVFTDRRIQETVEFVVAYLPGTLQLVIASRFDPPLPLARLRARGELAEIRLDDLRCTRDEGAALVAGVTTTSGSTAAGLVERTEGWPAGLHLAALALRDASDPAVAAAALRGDRRHILDFFSAEVLPGLDDTTRDLLVRCSVLERLSGPLCDAVLGTTGSATVLEHVERADLFVSALDGVGQWYRCHQLFRDVLRHELDATAPGAASRLLDRAAAWFLAEGRVEDAVRHRIAAGDDCGALKLLRDHSRWFLDTGAMATFLQLGERVAGRCATDPCLSVWMAWAAGLSGQPDRTVAWLESVEPLIDDAADPPSGWCSLRGCADTAWAIFGVPGDPEAALRHARRAVAHENDPDDWGWAAARRALGGALYGAGEVSEQAAVLDEVWRARGRARLPTVLVLQIAGNLALGLVELGHLDRAGEVSAEVTDVAAETEKAWGEGAAAAVAVLRLAEARLTAARRGAAAALPGLRRAVELAEAYGRSSGFVAAVASLAGALWAVGDHASARRMLDHGHELARAEPPPRRATGGIWSRSSPTASSRCCAPCWDR